MTFLSRPLSAEADISRMAALACQQPEDNLHGVDLPYRLSSWALDDPENARLWFDGDHELAAWAVTNSPFWTVDVVCRPNVEEDLHPEVMAWADSRLRAISGTPYGHPCWFVYVFSSQTNRIRAVERLGFARQGDVGENSPSKVLMRRSGSDPVRIYPPPPGFTVRPLRGEAEVESYVDLHRAVFESRNMTVDWRKRTLRQPEYQPDLDIVVETSDGRLGAFCICWLDKALQAGRVEPLGCHKDFRRYALGRVALSAGLRRLQTLGAKNIYVETDNWRNTAFLLYQSFDFQVIREVLEFRKDYP